MKNNTFDSYAEDYKKTVNSSISFSGLEMDFFTEVKVHFLKNLLNTHLSSPQSASILDIGCGVGETDALLSPFFPQITGVDVSEESLLRAQKKNALCHYLPYNGVELPFKDNHFDAAFTINVMHHVPPKQWPSFVKEAMRVVKPGGTFTIFEHNPYNPLTRKAVRECPFDSDAVLLKRGQTLKLLQPYSPKKIVSHYILYFPFRPSIFRQIEQKIGFIPLGAQYFVCAQKR